MFCSTIIPTIGRPTVARAVESLLTQKFDTEPFEVVVVNDSGQPLPEADWQNSPQVRIVNTNRRERSTARNTGAAVARGRYLHFLDDDDWLLPGALQAFWEASQANEANFLYGHTQIVDRTGELMFTLKHHLAQDAFIALMSGEWIPLQSSLIRSELFFSEGGFYSWMIATEDTDLCRRVLFHGQVVEVAAPVSCVGRGEESSSSHLELQTKFSRLGREMVLDKEGVFSSLRQSASSAYWKGRISYIYLTSVLWNLQHRKLLRALSRLLYGLASLLTAVPYLFSVQFWRAVVLPFKSFTFVAAQQEANVEQSS